jgi:hypothetical protein
VSAAVWRRAHLTPRRYVRSISIAKDGIPVSLFPSRRGVTVLSRYNHGTHNHGTHNHDTHNHGTHNHGTHNHDTHNHDTHNHDTHNHGTHDHGTHDNAATHHGNQLINTTMAHVPTPLPVMARHGPPWHSMAQHGTQLLNTCLHEVLREVPQAMDGPQAACGILLVSSRLLGKRTPWAHAQPVRHQSARTTPVVASDQVCSLPTGGFWLQAYLLCLAVPYRTVPGPLGLVALAALAAVSPPEVAPCCQLKHLPRVSTLPCLCPLYRQRYTTRVDGGAVAPSCQKCRGQFM